MFYYERLAVILVIFLRFIEAYFSSSDSSADSGFKMQESEAVSKVMFFSGGKQFLPRLDKKSLV